MLSTHQTAVAQTEVAVVNGDQHKHTSRRTATSDRKTAVIVGVLFITATVANLLSTSLTRSLVTAPDYLRSLSASGNHVLVGALLALIAALASASIAMALYPVLRHYNEGLALGSVGFRLIEAVFYHLGARGPLPSGMGVNGPLPLGNLRATVRMFARAMNPCLVAFGPAPLGDLSN